MPAFFWKTQKKKDTIISGTGFVHFSTKEEAKKCIKKSEERELIIGKIHANFKKSDFEKFVAIFRWPNHHGGVGSAQRESRRNGKGEVEEGHLINL